MFLPKEFQQNKKPFQELQTHHPAGSQDIGTIKKDSSNIRNAVSWLSQFVSTTLGVEGGVRFTHWSISSTLVWWNTLLEFKINVWAPQFNIIRRAQTTSEQCITTTANIKTCFEQTGDILGTLIEKRFSWLKHHTNLNIYILRTFFLSLSSNNSTDIRNSSSATTPPC